MADLKISDLSAAASLAGTDVLEIDTGAASNKVTASQIQTFVLNGVTLAELAILDGATLTTTELNFVDGVTSSIQTQLDSKPPNTRTISTTAPLDGGGDLSANRTLSLNITGLSSDTPVSADEVMFYDVSGTDINKTTFSGIKTLLNGGYTASRALETDGSGNLQVSGTTAADLDEIEGIANNDQALRVFLTNQNISSTGAQTLGTTHQNSFLYMTNTSTTTWTIPPNSTTAFNIGTEIEFWRSDASVVITEGSGVTLNGHDGTNSVTSTATLATQHTGCCIKKVATDTWVVFGRFTAS